MLIENQTIKVAWHNKTKEHYESCGYVFTNYRDYFYVKVEDLSSGSGRIVNYKCDYCGKDMEDTYKTYLSKLENSVIKKDCCISCVNKKNCETNLLLYGVEYPNQRKEVREKTEKTNMDRYGGVSPSQNKNVRQKQKDTMLQKYGVEHGLQCPEILNKVQATNIERYGGVSPSQNKEVIDKQMSTMKLKYGGQGRGSKIISEKIDKTNLSKYGRTTMVTEPSVREKANRNLKKNKKAKSSKQQEYIHSVIGGIFNYPINYYLLDIAFKDDMIYVEYDGSGHDLPVRMGRMTEEEFIIKEHERFLHMKNLGWREIRIISLKDMLPNKEELHKLIFNTYNKMKIDTSIDKIVIDLEELNLELKKVDKLIGEKGDY